MRWSSQRSRFRRDERLVEEVAEAKANFTSITKLANNSNLDSKNVYDCLCYLDTARSHKEVDTKNQLVSHETCSRIDSRRNASGRNFDVYTCDLRRSDQLSKQVLWLHHAIYRNCAIASVDTSILHFDSPADSRLLLETTLGFRRVDVTTSALSPVAGGRALGALFLWGRGALCSIQAEYILSELFLPGSTRSNLWPHK